MVKNISSQNTRGNGCRLLTLSENKINVARFIDARLATSSHAAYRRDVALFVKWGGHIPSDAFEVARYIAALSERCATATIKRRLSAIQSAHDALNVRSPTVEPLVRHAMRGISRTLGTAQRQAVPVTKKLLAKLMRSISNQSAGDVRDRALLLLGFSGAFRRAELTALDVDDFAFSARGMVVTVRRSKTDQEGQGRKVAIPRSKGLLCAVTAITKLLRLVRCDDDFNAVFRRTHRSGSFLKQRLSSAYVSSIVKQRLTAIGIDATNYSAHSLRAGLVTEAARAGVPSWKIRQQTGHKSDAMLARYIRDVEIWSNNAAGKVLR
jgi:integrase